MVDVGRVLWVHLVQPLFKQGSQKRKPRPTTRQLLELSKEETLHPPGSLCQQTITYRAQKQSWYSEGPSYIPVCTLCLVSALDTRDRGSILFAPFFHVCIDIANLPNFLQAE